MILHFIRHGESEANLINEFSNGLGKHPLTEKGRQQARELASRLKGLPIVTCYTSPILRAVETARILSIELDIPYQLCDALREFDVGILEGRSDETSWQQFFQLWKAWFDQGDWEQRIEGGESLLDVQKRFLPFIDSLLGQYAGTQSHFLLVGHGGIFRGMLPFIFQNIDFTFIRQHNIPNTAIISAESTSEGLVCIQWGEINLAQ